MIDDWETQILFLKVKLLFLTCKGSDFHNVNLSKQGLTLKWLSRGWQNAYYNQFILIYLDFSKFDCENIQFAYI